MQKKDIKREECRCTIIIWGILLSVFVIWICSAPHVDAAMRVGKVEESEVFLELNAKYMEENIPFQIGNMLPGDSKKQNYRLKVHFADNASVNFCVEGGEGDKKLLEVLMTTIKLVGSDEILYEGPIEDVYVKHDILADGTTEQELLYEVTIGMGTSVGNEYQNLTLSSIDLIWWLEVEEKQPEIEDDSSTEGNESDVGDDLTGEEDGIRVPGTGDDSLIILYLAVIIVIMILLGIMLKRYPKGIKKGMFLLAFLVLGFSVTSLALIYQRVLVEDNQISTGIVDIELKEEEPIFGGEMVFEPGMHVKKNVTVCNKGTCDVYFRLYFDNVVGELADILRVEVTDKEKLLYSGEVINLTQEADVTCGLLAEGEERELTISFCFPKECGNMVQNHSFTFDIKADAVQVANNPNKLYE